MKKSAVLNPQSRRYAHGLIDDAPDGYWVTVKPATRSLEQNSRMWACLGDIAAQVVWHGKKLTAEDWKSVFTAALKKMDVVPNIDGTGFVALGQSTSRMTKRELSDLMDLIGAFGAEHGVNWTEPSEAAALSAETT